MGSAMGTATQSVSQPQTQTNSASTGEGGNDNVHADTSVTIYCKKLCRQVASDVQ